MSAADKLGQLGAQLQGVSIAKMKVDAVRDDGTVNLARGEVILAGVPCFSSYTDRKAGDVVSVLQWSGGWCVMGKTGPAWDPSDSIIKLGWGSSAPPGDGWVTGTVYARDGELFIQTSEPSPPPSPTPTPTAKPVTVSPSSQGAWRDGARDNEQDPTQGAWPSYPHPYTGGWFYGSGISSACSGKTVQSMSIKVARTSAIHGSYGGVRPRFYLLSASSAGSSTPSLGDGPKYGPALGLGSSASWTLPTAWADALASGAAGGIGISAGVGSEYLVCTGSCGQITITFD